MRLGDAAHSDEDLGEFIPGGIIDDACLRQIEDALEDAFILEIPYRDYCGSDECRELK